ncbi:adenylate/guanylate cyclase domain-containing protein [Thermodesulfobacteriota bacterium]
MTTDSFQRKLAAILSADVQGYSRLMGDDEDATVRTLTAYRDVIAALVRQYRGRVVDSPGDNLLAEFASVVDAVQCAVEVQQVLKAKNADLPEKRRMEFRIGINLGDVIQEGQRIYGDGVNIAARMESLARAGGICISGSAYEQIENKLALGYEYMGEHSVKNIAKPIRVYSVPMKRDTAEPQTGGAHESPDQPSVAVLPFVNMSGDPEQEYFSDGITEEIITALSKISQLLVIARNSSFTYKGKQVKIQQVAEELGVRYVLEGSIRKAGNRVRITAQLIDGATGHHLWADRYDRELKDIFALQDEITMKILTAMRVNLTEGDQARVYDKSTNNLDSFMKFLQGQTCFFRFNKEGNIEARQLLEESAALDLENAAAYTMLAWTYLMEVWMGWGESPEQSMERAVEFAQKALALSDTVDPAHSLLSHIHLLKGQNEEALAEAKLAVTLNPNGADARAHLGLITLYLGGTEEAIQLIEKAIRLNPIPPNWYLHSLGDAYVLTGQYEKAIAEYSKVLQRNPDYMAALIGLTAAYSCLGWDEARASAAQILKMEPKFSVDSLAGRLPFKNKSDKDHFVNALSDAGLK